MKHKKATILTAKELEPHNFPVYAHALKKDYSIIKIVAWNFLLIN